MANTERLIFQLQADVQQARREIKQLQGDLGKTEKGVQTVNKETDNMTKLMKKAAGAMAAVFSVGAVSQLIKKVVEVSAEFEKFEAVLATTLGTTEAASKAMLQIQKFASETPFSVRQLTDSFVRLANQGLKPSMVEMRKLGDVAASTGKSFDQLAEAIIDATVGEFERLKEFGIRAEKMGDQVAFSFKGVRTEVDFTREAINDYLVSLGDVEGVSGSMANISETLGGRISNLGDEFDQLFNELGKANEGVLKGTVSILGDLTKAMKDAVVTASIAGVKGAGIAGFFQSLFGGQTISDVVAMGAAIDDSAKLIKDTVEEEFIADMADQYKDLLEVMEDFAKTLPKLPANLPYADTDLMFFNEDEALDARGQYKDLLVQMYDDYNDFTSKTTKDEIDGNQLKLSSAGQLAAGLSELAAQGSAEAKALQTSATLIDTYAAAVAAYKSTAAIPIIGPGLAPIAAAAAVAFGLAQVKRIQSFGMGGFTGKGDYGRDEYGPIAGVVHQDEFVFNREKTSKLRPLLEDIHNDRINVSQLADLTRRGTIKNIINADFKTERMERELVLLRQDMKSKSPFYDEPGLKVRGNTIYKKR